MSGGRASRRGRQFAARAPAAAAAAGRVEAAAPGAEQVAYVESAWKGGWEADSDSWHAAGGRDDQWAWFGAENGQEGDGARSGPGRKVRHRGRRQRKSSGTANGGADAQPGAGAGAARRGAGGARRAQPAADDRTGAPEEGAAASGGSGACDLAASQYFRCYGDARELGRDQRKCEEVMAILEQDKREAPAIYDWVAGSVLELSLKKGSCRLVQKLIEAVGLRAYDRMLAELLPGFFELIDSDHGNHVLSKAVEAMPSCKLTPLVSCVLEHDYLAVARHRFGCRVLERIIEHCTEAEERAMLTDLLDRLVDKSGELSRNPYGNFVVKHMLEHCNDERKGKVVEKLLDLLPPLAAHRNGSHVMQSALQHAGPEAQQRIILRLLEEAPPLKAPAENGGKPALTLLDVAKSRYGSFVVEEILKIRQPATAALRDQVRDLLLAHKEELLHSPFFERCAKNTGLVRDGADSQGSDGSPPEDAQAAAASSAAAAAA